MQQSLWPLIFCPIDLSWLKDSQEVLCGLGCIEAWEENVPRTLLGRTGFYVVARNSKGLDGVTQVVTSPPMFLSALVGQVSSLAASSLPALLMCNHLVIFAHGFDS